MEPFLLASSSFLKYAAESGILLGFPLNRDGSLSYHQRYSDLVQGAPCAGENNVYHEKADARCTPKYRSGRDEVIVQSFAWSSPPERKWYFGICTGTGTVSMSRNRYQVRAMFRNVDNPNIWGECNQFLDYDGPITEPGRYDYHSETWWRTYDLPVWTQSEDGYSSERFYAADFRECEPIYTNYPLPLLVKEMVTNRPSIPNGVITSLYSDAISAIRLESNQIANVLEIASLIGETAKVLAHGPVTFFKEVLENIKSKGSKNAATLWLAYRYQYCTTKSDVEDVIEKLTSSSFEQDGNLILRSGTIFNETRLNLKVELQSVYSNKFAEQHKQLMKYGGALTPYNLWDMVPFSFVVDWFLPIGDNLALADLDYYFKSAAYRVIYSELSWKIKDQRQVGSDTINLSAYSRDIGTRVPTFSVYEENPSTKTVVKRCLDAGSLLLG